MTLKKIASTIFMCTLMVACNQTQKKTDSIFVYSDYINQTTTGEVSVASPIKISLVKSVISWVPNEEIITDIFSISPAIKGTLVSVDSRTLLFHPKENLANNEEYRVTVNLGKLYQNIPDELKEYTFKFKTIEQRFSVDVNKLQSYDKQWQYIEGVVETADVSVFEDINKIVSASQKEKKLNLKWQRRVNSRKLFDFKIDSIYRPEDDSEVSISWNGSFINAKDSKGNSKVKVLGRNNFSVLEVKVIQEPEQYLQINFSDALKKQQNFDGLVAIEKTKTLTYIVDGNVLKVYPKNRLEGNLVVSVFEGIKSFEGYKLKKSISSIHEFEQRKPALRMLSSGVILPNSTNLKINFEAINLNAVDVSVTKIYKNNVLQFLQNNRLGSSSYIYDVGNEIAFKTIQLKNNRERTNGKQKAYAIDLANLIKVEPGAIYRVEFSFNQEYSLYSCSEDSNGDSGDYWSNRNNPCHSAFYGRKNNVSTNVLGSNIGTIIKKGDDNSYFFAVNNLLTTNPISNAKVRLFNYQQQELAQSHTNQSGFTTLKNVDDAYFAIITHGRNTAYLKVDDGSSLSLSKYDVSGQKTKSGLKGYLYGERGVWRPGDSIHLTFVLNDKQNPLPKNHPIRLELRDAKGKLVYKKIKTIGLNKFSRFSISTSETAPTGNWDAMVYVGGVSFRKRLHIETIKPNRLKVKIDFEDEVLSATKPLKGKLAIKWLHGSPGKNLKAEVKVKFSETNAQFKNFETYVFNDPIRSFNTEEITVFEGQVDTNGEAKITKKLNIENQAPGMLRASFFTKAFEKGGDFSMDVFSKKYAPYTSFVGLKSPEPKAYGSFYTDENVTFDIATVSAEGKPLSRKNLEVKIYRIEWRWWWSSSYDDLSSYVGSEFKLPYKSFKISTNSHGKAAININIPDDEGGRYLIRITDKESGHSTGRTAYFYRNWWQRPSDSNQEAANMLIFSADKESYNVGDVAKITFPSSSVGRALISLENGTKILNSRWVNTKIGETTIEIPITKEMTPNIFANISLLQPHSNTSNDLPIRLYGVIPILVHDPKTKLEPVINMVKSIRPEAKFAINVSEKEGKPMTYTLAVVDDGLLDLTRFVTPNPWNEFYKREALGVKTWDMYDDVIGAYSGSIDQIFSIGGDLSLLGNKSKKANRFKPVVMYLGPFDLKPGQIKSHILKMPNYVGSVRTMVIAGDVKKSAYGNAQQTSLVKKPLMVLASLPRKLSPGEKVTLPVTVFAMEKKIKVARISLKTDQRIKVIGEHSQVISFDRPDEKMVYFDLEVLDSEGISEIEILASGSGEKASYKVEIDVVNPNPISKKQLSNTIAANETIQMDFSTFGLTGTNTATVEFSTIPPMDFTSRMAYLIQYPHGCVEQTTSSVFPQLFLATIFDLSEEKKKTMQKNIQNGIKRLARFQLINGGLSYWIGQRTANDWGTSYAGHFMIEASKKGYDLPLTFMTNWVNYQQQEARNWTVGHGDLLQAYRLYTLALAGYPDLASMNRLREYRFISNNGKWRLAATYALAGQMEAAKKIAATATVDFKNNTNDYYSYGSASRNRAMALETLVFIKGENSRKLAELIASELSSDKWMSTQTTAYSLLAMTKLVTENGGKELNLKFVINGQAEAAKTNKSLSQKKLNINDGLNQLKIENLGSSQVYINILNSGKLPLGNTVEEERNLGLNIKYLDSEGNLIDVSKLQQGTEFKAIVKVTNIGILDIKNVALTEIFPSGWEVVNLRFTDFGPTVTTADFTDIRDDRANFYFDLRKGVSRSFEVKLNASYLGNYYLYGVQVEAMYNNDYFARTKGQWVEVVK